MYTIYDPNGGWFWNNNKTLSLQFSFLKFTWLHQKEYVDPDVWINQQIDSFKLLLYFSSKWQIKCYLFSVKMVKFFASFDIACASKMVSLHLRVSSYVNGRKMWHLGKCFSFFAFLPGKTIFASQLRLFQFQIFFLTAAMLS